MIVDQLKSQLTDLLKSLDGQVALYVKFLNSGDRDIFGFNENNQFWAASVIKIPIACEFFRQVHFEKIEPSKKVKIEGENRVGGSGVLRLLDTSDEFTLLDLIVLMLAVSDNAATNVIVDLIGWENVGKYMCELGLTQTTFKHKMMIKAGRGPNLTTAYEISLLLEKLYKNEFKGSEEILDILKKQQDRTRIPLLLPNDLEIAHKTGSLPEAMHDVGIIYAKNPFIFSFLSDDQNDKRKTNNVLANCSKLCFDFASL